MAATSVNLPYNAISTVVETVQYVQPVAAATVAGASSVLVVDPAGTLATLTITFPVAPVDGQAFTISSTQIVTLLSFSGGTIVGAITALAVGGFAKFVYSSSSGKWHRAA